MASGGTVGPTGEVDVCESEGFASVGWGWWVEALCEAWTWVQEVRAALVGADCHSGKMRTAMEECEAVAAAGIVRWPVPGLTSDKGGPESEREGNSVEVRKHEDEACEALPAKDGPVEASGHATEAVVPVGHSERAQEVEGWPARVNVEKATLEGEVLVQTECEKAGLLKQSAAEGWGWWALMETLVKGVMLHLTTGA